MNEIKMTVNHTTEITEITKAFLQFDELVSKIGKSANNPFFKSKYAALPDILDAIKGPLIESGLTVRQFPVGMNGLTTFVIHAESGQYFSSELQMKPTKEDPQGQGSAITYMRRYALCSILSLSVDEDVDANDISYKDQKNIQATEKKKERMRLLDFIRNADTVDKLLTVSKYVDRNDTRSEYEAKLKTLSSKIPTNE